MKWVSKQMIYVLDIYEKLCFIFQADKITILFTVNALFKLTACAQYMPSNMLIDPMLFVLIIYSRLTKFELKFI